MRDAIRACTPCIITVRSVPPRMGPPVGKMPKT